MLLRLPSLDHRLSNRRQYKPPPTTAPSKGEWWSGESQLPPRTPAWGQSLPPGSRPGPHPPAPTKPAFLDSLLPPSGIWMALTGLHIPGGRKPSSSGPVTGLSNPTSLMQPMGQVGEALLLATPGKQRPVPELGQSLPHDPSQLCPGREGGGPSLRGGS